MKHTDYKERIQEQLFAAEEWDGTERIDTLFADYLGVDDNPHTREVSRRFCIEAVAGIMEPDSRQALAPVLHGVQGCGKTTLLQALCGGGDYFAEDPGLLSNRTLICETEETDADTLKAFLNKDGKRHGIFCATSNRPYRQTEDETIIPLQCGADPVHGQPAKKSPWKLDIREVRQIWAEAYTAWKDSLK